MKVLWRKLLFFSIPFFMVGCSSKVPLQLGSTAVPLVSENRWSIQLFSHCSNAVSNQCVASSGFKINSVGEFRIGPGPRKQILYGVIAEKDLKSLKDSMAPYFLVRKLNSFFDETCIHRAEEHLALQAWVDSSSRDFQLNAMDNSDKSNSDKSIDKILIDEPTAENQTKETETKETETKETELMHTTALDFCFSMPSQDQAQSIYKTMKKLANTYYPLPFPQSACDEAVGVLEKLHRSVQSCSEDSSCVYVDDNLDAIERMSKTFILSNDCSTIRSLLVANSKLLTEYRSSLAQEKQNAQQACQSSEVFMGCSGFSKLRRTQPAPVCLDGFCTFH